jgi:ABC-type uncharacterized transport system substrate-binding protein
VNQPVKQNGTNMLLRTLRLPKLLIKKPFYLAFCVLLFTFCSPVQGQQKTQTPSVGVLLALPYSRLALKNRLPAMYQVSESVEAGGLVTYGVSTVDLWRRAATYVDKILERRQTGGATDRATCQV